MKRLATVVGIAVLVGAAFTPGAISAQQYGGTLVFTVPAPDYPSMDGHQEETFAMIHPIAPHYSLLIRLDPKVTKGDRLEGDLAAGWKVSRDQRTYTFALRRNVRFHDGTPLTAKDVVASLWHIINPPEGVVSPRKSYFAMVEGIATRGDYTVVVYLKYPTRSFLPALAQPFNFIYPERLLEKDPNYFKTHVMGSGPFRFKSEKRRVNWIGVRNPAYFKKGLPYLDGFEALFTSKESDEIQALRRGESQIQFRGFAPRTRDELKADLGNRIAVQESIWNCGTYVVLNTFKKPFMDVRVRQALNLAIDRWGGSQVLAKVAIAKAVGGHVMPGSPLAMGDDELAQLPGYWRDVEKSRKEARRLLKEAGVPEGFTFVLNNRTIEQPYKYIGDYVIDQWQKVGLQVQQIASPSNLYFANLEQDPPQYDVAIDFNCQSMVNPTADIQRFISKDRTDGNHGHYIDRKLDELFDAQLREPDFVRQKRIVDEFERYLNDQAYWLTTLWWNRIVLHSSRVHGWNITPSHYLNQQLEVVWLSK